MCLRRFFTFVLLMFLLHSMGIGMFRCIASLCRDETISSTGGSFFFLALLLLGGFLLARRALHLASCPGPPLACPFSCWPTHITRARNNSNACVRSDIWRHELHHGNCLHSRLNAPPSVMGAYMLCCALPQRTSSPGGSGSTGSTP